MNQTKQRTIKSPNRNVSKNELLIIAEAETLVKEEITYGVSHGLSKEEIYAKCSKIIAKYISLLPEERKSVCRKSLLQMLIRDYTLFSMNAKTIMRNARDAILGYTIKSVNDLFAKKEDIITRGFKTDRKHGLAIISKYQKQLRNEIKILSATQAEVSEIINSKPNKMTLRNKAEMTIRYEANLEDIKRFQEKNIDLVWTSSHVDCSKRCEPYQGKLWSISGKNAGKTIDGNKVGNLNEALQGSKKDGNGIINGYNCRHYLIEYTKGSKPPIDYDRASIKKEREINNKQRLYERNIRQLKLQERLARKQGDKDVAKKINEKWKLLEKKYKSFSLKSGRAFYEWRTRIMRNETLQSNKWGDEEYRKVYIEIAEEKEQENLHRILKERIESGIVSKEINKGKQNKHIIGTNEYNYLLSQGQEKPYLTKSPEELIKFQGIGKISMRADGQIMEMISIPEQIGVYVSHLKDGSEIRVPTNRFEIRYSKKGTHIIPKPPKTKKGE